MKKLFNFLWVFTLLLFIGCTKEKIQVPADFDATLTARGEKIDVPFKVPLKGELTFTTVTRTPGNPTIEVFAGGGKLTHLGKVTCVVTQNIPSSGGFFGTFEITAANGDLLTSDYSGGITSLNPQTLEFTSETDFDITGGSGRFDAAEGSGKVFGSGVFPQFPPVDDLTINVKFDGRISY